MRDRQQPRDPMVTRVKKIVSKAEILAHRKQRKRLKRNSPARSEVAKWRTNITTEREILNLSMRDVAEAVGLAVPSYFRIEHGYADVSLSNAYSIAEFFGKTVYELWPQWRGKK